MYNIFIMDPIFRPKLTLYEGGASVNHPAEVEPEKIRLKPELLDHPRFELVEFETDDSVEVNENIVNKSQLIDLLHVETNLNLSVEELSELHSKLEALCDVRNGKAFIRNAIEYLYLSGRGNYLSERLLPEDDKEGSAYLMGLLYSLTGLYQRALISENGKLLTDTSDDATSIKAKLVYEEIPMAELRAQGSILYHALVRGVLPSEGLNELRAQKERFILKYESLRERTVVLQRGVQVEADRLMISENEASDSKFRTQVKEFLLIANKYVADIAEPPAFYANLLQGKEVDQEELAAYMIYLGIQNVNLKRYEPALKELQDRGKDSLTSPFDLESEEFKQAVEERRHLISV